MKRAAASWAGVVFCYLVVSPAWVWGGDLIPIAAWKRPMGAPLADAGTKKPTLESSHIDDGYWQGSPVGGFGAGTLSRDYRGNFSRWHLKAGVHKYETIYANQFAMYQKAEAAPEGVTQVLTTDHPSSGALSSWKWDYPVGAGDYRALYPKSWFDYRWEKFPAHVVLEQFSPILPDNYREASYPAAIYRWHAENPTQQRVTVSIMLSWTNMVGWFRTFSHDFRGHLSAGDYNQFVKADGVAGAIKGIVFDHNRTGAVQDEWDGQFVIAAQESPGIEISYQTTFDPGGDGKVVWAPLAKDGRLANSDESWTSSDEDLAGAIAVRFTLNPGEKRIIPMVIAWDLPITEFGSGRKWYRRYTDFYGKSGSNAWKIAQDVLAGAARWSDAIDAWQAPYVNDKSKPLWYRGMLFNEMYIVADGGSFWGRPLGAAPKIPATFAFLECYDYPYYATLDVLFYGSMPVVKFWPELDKQMLRQFADTVPENLTGKYIWIWKSLQTGKPEFRVRKAKGAVPHDLGVPQEDAFAAPNQFSWQNTNDWKDLNSKFVLMVWRDYVITGKKDAEFLKYTWPAVQEAMQHLQQYDRDGDGIPENDGYPDQTYDEWVVRGPSAYCGGLWLGSLRAAEEMARAAGQESAARSYHSEFEKAQASYIKKLWSGEYFLYDTGSEYKDNIQADQLAGQWYASMTGLGDLVPREMQLKALNKIFNFNVMKFSNGDMGAVNGMAVDGSIIQVPQNQQVQEVWGGTTFGLAALMLSDGLKDEAYRTAWGIYNVTYEKKGYWFRTPEAWDMSGNYRASMYMRPAAIWAMEMTRIGAQQVAADKSPLPTHP